MSEQTTLPKIWEAFPELEQPLQRVVQQLEATWQIPFPEIKSAVHAQLFAGKLVRPAVVVLFSQLNEQSNSDKVIKLASVVELLHYATLVHDDVIDNADKRRGYASVQSALGADTAIYTGDYLFVLLFELLNNIHDQALNATAMQALRDILYGELHQKANRFDTDMTIERYLEQIQGKTAALFQLSAYFGAKSADVAHDLRKTAENIGLHLGIAFQLMDDYLDFVGEEAVLGKPANQDIFNGIYTAPVIVALSSDSPIREELQVLLRNPDFNTRDYQQAKTLISTTNALDQLKDLIEYHTQQTRDLIEQIPVTHVRQQLEQITNMLLMRTY
jgi:heptaprenyl diphosphate synthase